MSEQDVHAGLAGKPFQQGMNYDDYERGVRQRLGEKVEVPGIAYTLIFASPLLLITHPVLGLACNGGFALAALLAAWAGAKTAALLIGFFVGIAAFFPGLWLEARASQVSLYRVARTGWRILAPVVPAILVHFDESGFRFRPDALSEASGEMVGAGILTGLVIHFVCRLLDKLYFPVKAHVLKEREEVARGIQPTRSLVKRLVFCALWIVPIYILCKVAFMIGVRVLVEDVRSVEAFNASYSTIVYAVSGVVWALSCLFGILPGTSKRVKKLVDPNLVEV
jgi:hypothetical protein